MVDHPVLRSFVRHEHRKSLPEDAGNQTGLTVSLADMFTMMRRRSQWRLRSAWCH
jgi:hypothetical protein